MTGFKTKAELQRRVDQMERLLAVHDTKVDGWLTRLAAWRYSPLVVYPVLLLAIWGAFHIVWSLAK